VEAVVAYFKIPSRHLPGETEDNHYNLNEDRPRHEHGTTRIRSRSANHWAAMTVNNN
jgi:hypothetical protein